ncbi:MAG: hypothetical protein ACXWQO_16555 [Bdellovibrionota bacterium]
MLVKTAALLSLLCLSPLAHAKTAAELNASRMARTPSSEMYQDDKYVVSVVEATEAIKALKARYKTCKMTGVTVAEPLEHLVPKTVHYTCIGKTDGKVEISAATEVAGWGETTDITITLLGVAGATN